jgi:pimeloyl-ACP methyl ester carboxylesterase
MPTTEPRLNHVLCADPLGLHRLAYTEWGDPANPRVLVCAHGLTRSGRDFDALARRLSTTHRVLCPDMPGRGASDWLRDPRHYMVAQYVADCVTLIARAGVSTVEWLGTSMGGIIGMVLASFSNTPIARLVLNDVGPKIEDAGLARIGSYVGDVRTYGSFEEGLAHVLSFSAGFGPHTDEQWAAYNKGYVVQREGVWTLHYDPAIVVPIRATGDSPPQTLWAAWETITCPTLVVRGEQSDILSRETVTRMTETGPRAQSAEVAGVGHAPTFVDEAQIELVSRFLAPA